MKNRVFPQTYRVTSHSDHVGRGSTFVAMAGAKHNGEHYIVAALQKGATRIVVAQDAQIPDLVIQEIKDFGAELVKVKNPHTALPLLAAQAYDNPAKKLKIIGITGTKGKTSTAYLTYQLLRTCGRKVALLSTVERRILDMSIDLELTTPQPDHIHAFLHTCVQHEVEYVVMEVSAQALTLHRVDGIEFDVAVFTNFSLEHLEFYPDLDTYFKEKCRIFDHAKKDALVLVNTDDERGQALCLQNKHFTPFALHDYSAAIRGMAHLQKNQLVLDVKTPHSLFRCHTQLFGKFNAYNALAACGIALHVGVSQERIQEAIHTVATVPGRMEAYRLRNDATCFIDFAHNPSSYKAVLSSLRFMTDHLIVVFGAGGERDKSKRPLMGAYVDKYADVAVLTSDNPRSENPETIMNDIMQGFAVDTNLTILREIDRTKAIRQACAMSRQGSIVAILGKSQDEYQIIGNLKFPFKERAILQPYVKEKVTKL